MGRPSKPRRPRLQGDFGDLQAVAVLPFDNLSKDPAEDYFVDGLTEDIITALAYWRWFPVVARNSTFAYKGKPKNVTEIGRELGAAYLVEGSARRSGEQVRITVQLIEAATGHHLFAARYDRKIADVFIVQEEIAERIVASIEPEIHRAEARRAVAQTSFRSQRLGPRPEGLVSPGAHDTSRPCGSTQPSQTCVGN